MWELPLTRITRWRAQSDLSPHAGGLEAMAMLVQFISLTQGT